MWLQLSQQLEAVTREKDGMVVRYATSEKEVIVARKALEEADKRLRDLAKERDQYFSRVRSLSQERSRLCTNLDTKVGGPGNRSALVRWKCHEASFELHVLRLSFRLWHLMRA